MGSEWVNPNDEDSSCSTIGIQNPQVSTRIARMLSSRWMIRFGSIRIGFIPKSATSTDARAANPRDMVWVNIRPEKPTTSSQGFSNVS